MEANAMAIGNGETMRGHRSCSGRIWRRPQSPAVFGHTGSAPRTGSPASQDLNRIEMNKHEALIATLGLPVEWRGYSYVIEREA